MIFWGPPGTGKTTLGRLIAEHTDRAFVPFSAVTEGVPRVREIVAEAAERLRRRGRGTILFVDEIHRFNKAQQDAFLPHVESGHGHAGRRDDGEPVVRDHRRAALAHARVRARAAVGGRPGDAASGARSPTRSAGSARMRLTVDDDARRAARDAGRRRRAARADGARGGGGARRRGRPHHRRGGARGAAAARSRATTRAARSTSTSSQRYHKSLRGSDPQGALYWMARMIEGGEDPMIIFRRAMRDGGGGHRPRRPARRSSSPSRRATRTTCSGRRRAISRSRRWRSTSRPRRSRTASYVALNAALEAAREHARRRRCRCTSATRRRSS